MRWHNGEAELVRPRVLPLKLQNR